MKLSGEYKYDVSQERLWKALLDPEILAGTLPGCEELQRTGENAYRGKLKMKVGPVQGVFEGTVELTNLDAPNSYDLTIDGKGAPGFMKGTGSLRLEPDGEGTLLHYEIDAQVGGRIASVGQRLVESSAKVITKQGLQGLERQLEPTAPTASATEARGHEPGGEEAGDPDDVPTEDLGPKPAEKVKPAAAAPSQAEFAGEFVKGLAGELIPKKHRPTLIAAVVLIVIIVAAVAMRSCGG